jgi:hypothetical protein
MLKAYKIVWSQIDTFEFANYVKNSGHTWIDNFEPNMTFAFDEISVKTGGDNNAGKNSGETSGSDNNDGGGWDTGRN